MRSLESSEMPVLDREARCLKVNNRQVRVRFLLNKGGRRQVFIRILRVYPVGRYNSTNVSHSMYVSQTV